MKPFNFTHSRKKGYLTRNNVNLWSSKTEYIADNVPAMRQYFKDNN